MTDIIDDWKGDPIKIGTRVLHHARNSTSIHLKLGSVVELRQYLYWGRPKWELKMQVEMSTGYGGTDPGKVSKWIQIENVTVVSGL